MKQVPILAIALGLAATFPAYAGQKVYVPMGGADEVIVIDTEQDKIVGSIKAITESHGLAGSSDGSFLIAGSLDEFELSTTTPPKPENMAQDEHDAHHAGEANTQAKKGSAVSYLSVIGTDNNLVQRRVAVTGSVHHTLITPQNDYAVATHPGEGGISVVDLNTYEVKTVATGPVPNYAVSSPGGQYVYVSNAGNNTVSKLDTKRWIVRQNVEVGDAPEHMVLSSDGEWLFVNNTGDGTVSMVSWPSGQVTKTFKVGGDIHGIDLSDDDQTLYVAGRENNRMTVINVMSGLTSHVPLGPSPYHLAAIDGTDKLYVSSAEEDKIWVIDQRSLKTVNEIPVSDRAHQMVVVR